LSPENITNAHSGKTLSVNVTGAVCPLVGKLMPVVRDRPNAEQWLVSEGNHEIKHTTDTHPVTMTLTAETTN